MPDIMDTPPAAVSRDMDALRAALAALPAKDEGNVLVATWNLRAFASLSRVWTAGTKDNPRRDLRGLLAIGEIVRRFDVVALQEVKGDLRALRDLLRWLGDEWAFLMTDVTLGDAGNDERMAFLFDTRRVKPSGLACELVVPPEWLGEIGADALKRQFARTPYAVSFKAGELTFILVTLHVSFGDPTADRLPELKGIARWLAQWAKRERAWAHNLIALGDFNIDRRGDPLWQAFVSTGLTTPDELNSVPRTLFDSGKAGDTAHFYDQIAWFPRGGDTAGARDYRAAGYVDFCPYVYGDQSLTRQALSYRVSDHYPLWVEFVRG